MRTYPHLSQKQQPAMLLIAAFMVCCLSVHVALGQQHPERYSPVFSFETLAGNVWSNAQRSDLIGGIGLCYYWNLHRTGEKRRHYYGLDVVTRGLMASENEPESTRRRFMEQASLAVLFLLGYAVAGGQRPFLDVCRRRT